MSKGSNSPHTDSSSSNAPDPAAYAAYQNLISRATNVSNKPYEAYAGEETAGINDQQRAGFGNINAGAEGFDPNRAWSDIGQGSSAVNANDIAAYQDPYTNQVIGATQRDFDTQNQRANSVVTGNAAAQGALGGNRVGVAQALTQEGQNRVQAPVIAGLRSAGFQSAEQMANQQKARQLQGGQTAEQLGMAGASAQVGAGTLEQQTRQAGDTQKMQDYYRAQGYDFQTAQWLASILLPTGSQMGSSTTGQQTTQGPQPNQWMQAAGLGISAAAAFSDRRLKENVEEVGKLHDGQKIYRYNFKGDPKTQIGLISQEVEKTHPDAVGRSRGFGTVDYEAATDDAVKRFDGGRISGFAAGGSPWEAGAGWVPEAKVTGTALAAPQLMKAPDMLSKPKDDTSKMGAGLGQIGKGLYDKSQAVSDPLDDYNPTQDTSNPNYAVGPEQSGFYDSGAGFGGGGLDFGSGGWARGGAVRRGFAEGGVPISTGFGGGFDDEDLSPNDAVSERFANPMLGSDQYKDMAGHSAALKAEGALRGQPQVADDTPDFSSRGRSALAPRGVAAAPSTGMGGFNPLNFSDEARQGLISMGLNMMANQRGGKGSALSSIGEGGIAGMTTYASAKAATALRDAQLRKEAFEREKFGSTEKHQRALERHQDEALKEQREFHTQSAQKPTPYTDDNGDSHMVFSRVNKDTRQLEHFDRNMTKGTTVRISPDDVAAPAPSPAPTTPVPVTPGPTASIPPTTTTDGADPAKAEPFDYRRGSPPIEKGADVPDPRPTSGRSADAIKVDAEKYALTGVLPPAPRGGNSPTAINTLNYRNAVQNYANALALSRGITPAQMAEAHRSAPGMLRFVLGADGRATVSLGTAVRHLDTIQELAKVWNAGDTQGFNRLSAFLSKQFGKEAGTTLEAAAHIVGPEIIKALGIAGAGTAEERENAAKMFSTASSPAQVKAAVDAVQRLLGGQLDGKRRQAAAAGVSETMFKNLIGDRPYEILSHAESGGGASTVTAPTGALKVGDRKQFKQGWGVWDGNKYVPE